MKNILFTRIKLLQRKRSEMLSSVKKQIEKFHMLTKGDRVLIGLSGGADSVCLAQILYELREEYDLVLGAACFDHGIRGEEAKEDVNFARAFCRERQIAFYTAKERIEERAKGNHITVEEAGRLFRYEQFRRIMEEQGYSKLAIAHNGDDRAETMLFHLARGTGIAGLATMEPVREFYPGTKLIRPLLTVKKKDIETWLIKRGINWRVDSTNSTDAYTRNRIRHHILPELEQINDRAIEHMGESAQHLGEILSYLKEEENRIYADCVSEKETQLMIYIPYLEKCHHYMKKAILYRCIGEMAGGKKDISSSHVEKLLDLMTVGSGKSMDFIKDVRAKRQYEYLILYKETFFTEHRQETLDNLHIFMEETEYSGQEILKNEYTKQFDCDKILNRLCVRFWQEGDYLYLREDGGKKKLSRYFIDARIPREERGRIPLLADGDHILWIVGHRISAYYKVTEQTKRILTVTMKNKG